MKRTSKVAISVPLETLRKLERVRRKLGKSRSAAIAMALDEWLRGQEPSEEDRRYVEAYLRRPERAEETGALAEWAISHWEPWE
jgi:metal-responsive CopG/Arc/MetJ family transcriptional regulator